MYDTLIFNSNGLVNNPFFLFFFMKSFINLLVVRSLPPVGASQKLLYCSPGCLRTGVSIKSNWNLLLLRFRASKVMNIFIKKKKKKNIYISLLIPEPKGGEKEVAYRNLEKHKGE